MSHVDSKDEEVKSILAQIDSNDSKESDKPNKNKGKTWIEKDDNGKEWETNDSETPDSEW